MLHLWKIWCLSIAMWKKSQHPVIDDSCAGHRCPIFSHWLVDENRGVWRFTPLTTGFQKMIDGINQLPAPLFLPKGHWRNVHCFSCLLMTSPLNPHCFPPKLARKSRRSSIKAWMGIVISTTGPPFAFILWGYINLYQPITSKNYLKNFLFLWGYQPWSTFFTSKNLTCFAI